MATLENDLGQGTNCGFCQTRKAGKNILMVMLLCLRAAKLLFQLDAFSLDEIIYNFGLKYDMNNAMIVCNWRHYSLITEQLRNLLCKELAHLFEFQNIFFDRLSFF